VIVDAHVHLLPGKLAEAVRRYFVEHLGAVHANLAYPLDHAEVLDLVAADGVGEVWSLPYAHKPGTAASMNESSAATAASFARGPVRVVGGATVHPADDDPLAIVSDAVERLGLRVLKLHCSVGRFDADDRRLDAVYAWCADRRLPVVVHLGHAPSGLTGVDELDALRRIAQRHAATRFVLAHCGHDAARTAIALLRDHPELHVDLTPVGRTRPELDAADVAPFAERVLFGSDAPNTPLRVGDGIRWVRALGLRAADEEAVLGVNAQRLIGDVVA
jgi:predicted TIM-barrel fold metal-dependent hydrolase